MKAFKEKTYNRFISSCTKPNSLPLEETINASYSQCSLKWFCRGSPPSCNVNFNLTSHWVELHNYGPLFLLPVVCYMLSTHLDDVSLTASFSPN